MNELPALRGELRRVSVALLFFVSACAAIPPVPMAPAGATPAPWAITPQQSAFLDTLSHRTFDFFWQTTNPRMA